VKKISTDVEGRIENFKGQVTRTGLLMEGVSPPQLATRRTCDRSCERFTTLPFIAPPAALGRWEFRLGSDRTLRPG
jgi:hypothetical protein